MAKPPRNGIGFPAERHPRAGASDRARHPQVGFSLIELLVALAVVSVLAMLVAAQFFAAYDRSRQRGTLADLRTIAMANGTYSVDQGGYAAALADLSPEHLGTVPSADRWGNAWIYSASSRSYSLQSQGADGSAGPAPPAGWTGEPYECDLVVQNGIFTQAPETQ